MGITIKKPLLVRNDSEQGDGFTCHTEKNYFLRGGTITVTTKDVVVVSPPASVTERVMIDLPALNRLGVIAKVRLEPLPPRTSPLEGISDGLEDDTPTTNEPAAVSKSPIVKAIVLFVLRYAMVMLRTVEMVGAVLVGGTTIEEYS